MVIATDLIVEIVKRYIAELEKNNIKVIDVVPFGFHATGNYKGRKGHQHCVGFTFLPGTDLKIAKRSYH